MYKNLVIAGMLLMSPVVYGQQKPEPAKQVTSGGRTGSVTADSTDYAPKLKQDVEVELLKSQKEMYELLLHLKTIEAQYAQIQSQFTAKQAQFNEVMGKALEKSGIDKDKFVIDANTLAVTPKPADPPKAAEAPKK